MLENRLTSLSHSQPYTVNISIKNFLNLEALANSNLFNAALPAWQDNYNSIFIYRRVIALLIVKRFLRCFVKWQGWLYVVNIAFWLKAPRLKLQFSKTNLGEFNSMICPQSRKIFVMRRKLQFVDRRLAHLLVYMASELQQSCTWANLVAHVLLKWSH